MTVAVQLDINDIRKKLRQRYPFLLVDRITEVEPMQRVVGYKNITINEPFFVGHFPEEPVFPGVLIIESMAQVGAMMFSRDQDGYLASVDKVKFIRFVKPGDRLQTEAIFLQEIKQYAKVSLKATVDGVEVAKAEVTYYFKPQEF